MNNELFLAYKCATDNFNCDCPQCDNDYFEIDYKSGHGHFKILRFNLICKFTLTDFKKVISMLKDDNAGPEKAENLHTLFVNIAKELNDNKDVFNYDKKILSGISEAFNRINKLNEILMNAFSVAALDIEQPIKMTKTTAYKMIKRDQLSIDYNAKAFNKFGFTWIVSSDTKIKGLKHIIVPCCGLPCASFNGSFKEAIEIVDIELKTRVEKALKNKTFPDFINLLKINGIEKIPA